MSELSDWKNYVLPGLLAEAKAQGRGESATTIESLQARIAELEAQIQRDDEVDAVRQAALDADAARIIELEAMGRKILDHIDRTAYRDAAGLRLSDAVPLIADARTVLGREK